MRFWDGITFCAFVYGGVTSIVNENWSALGWVVVATVWWTLSLFYRSEAGY